MHKRPSLPKLTSAHVIAAIALFFALAGGAYAATTIPSNSVGTSQVKASAITGAKVKDGSLKAKDFAAGQLPAGPQGLKGAAGPAGAAGAAGTQGAAGEPGAKGDTGAHGAAGAKGEAGTDGTDGAKGDRGERGAAGAKGETGPEGPRGEQGAVGSKGDRGATGAQGAQGDDGPAGPRGERGFNGEAGPRGERGPGGPAGEDGTDGLRGPKGERGEPGRQGEPGEEGPAGASGLARTVVRYGEPATLNRGPLASYATCERGEFVVGGGFDFLESPGEQAYNVRADRASLVAPITREELEEQEREREEAEEREEEVRESGAIFGENEEGEFFTYRAPKNGGTATGWAVSLTTTGKVLNKAPYRAYVDCMGTATRKETGEVKSGVLG